MNRLNDKNPDGSPKPFPVKVDQPYLNDTPSGVESNRWEFCSIELGIEEDLGYGNIRLHGVLPGGIAQRLANVPMLEAEVESQAATIGELQRELAELRQQYQIQQEASEASHNVAINHQRSAMEALRHSHELRSDLEALEKEHEDMAGHMEVLAEGAELHTEELQKVTTACSRLMLAIKHERKTGRVSSLCDFLNEVMENSQRVLGQFYMKNQDQFKSLIESSKENSK